MEFNLNALPTEQRIDILNKMSTKAFYRLRRAAKPVDNNTENNRTHIKFNASHLFFWIEVGNCEKVSYQIRRRKGFTDSYCLVKEVEDPYEQLSAMTFGGVTVKILSSNALEGSTEQSISNSKRIAIYTDTVKPLLQKMKLICDTYFIDTPLLEDRTDELISLVSFSKIYIYHSFNFNILQNPKIQHCEFGEFLKLTDLPKSLSLVFRNCTISTVLIDRLPEKRWSDSLPVFIQELRTDISAKGHIEELMFIEKNMKNNFEGKPGVNKVFSGDVSYHGSKWLPTTIFQIKMPNGWMAAVWVNCCNCVITFVHDDTREALFNAISPNMFWTTPFDVSTVFDQFLAIEDDVEAFKMIFEGFPDLIRKA